LAFGLVIVGLSGSAAGPPAAVSIPLLPAGNGQFEVVGDLLFVVESRTRWGAYDLATGQRRWSLERVDSASVELAVSGDLLVDRRYSFGRTFDPATGEVRWAGIQHRNGPVSWSTFRPAPDAGAGVVASHHSSTPDGSAIRLTGVDLATGAVLWQASPPQPVRVVLTGDPPRLVSVSADGRVELRAPDTGEVLAGRRMLGMARRAGVSGAVQVAVIGDRLVLARQDRERLALHGYELDTLAARWELAIPLAPETALWYPVEPCGSMLCVGLVPTLVDPVTGRVGWTARPDRQPIHPVGDRFLVYDPSGELRAVVDARTGRRVQDLTGWRAAVPPGAAPDRVLLTRPAAGARTRVVGLDPVSLVLTDLGLLPGSPELCRPYRAGLVCRHHDRLWVWPLPR
jgi:hypothetical protein